MSRQQDILIQDFIYVLSGVEGNYIKFKQKASILTGAENIFIVEPNLPQPTCDESLLLMINNCLLLPGYYDAIQKAIASYSSLECGLILHSICDTLHIIEKEYLMVVH